MFISNKLAKSINSYQFNKLTTFVTVILLVLCLSISSCAKKAEDKKPPGVPVQIEQLKLDDIENYSEYISTLISRKSIDILPRVEGPIDKIFVRDGDRISKGTVIMTIESSEQKAGYYSAKAKSDAVNKEIKQANTTLESYKAQVEADESELELAKLTYDRTMALFEKGSETQAQLDQDTNTYNKAKAELRSSREQVNTQKLLLEEKQSDYVQAKETEKQQFVQYDYYAIKAPFDGIVGYIPVKIGDYVTPQTTLTSLTENNQLEVQIAVDASLKSKLKEGMKIKIVDEDKNVLSVADIYFISPKVNLNNQTILVNAIVKNDENLFEAGEVITARLVLDIEKRLAVPTESVVNFAGQDYVFLVQKEKGVNIAKQTAVTLGDIQDNRYVVKDGLKEGDTVITSGVQKLKDNTPVITQADQKQKGSTPVNVQKNK
ncbi:MAG: efflux RND transporter periplasmic adaptor subunit [Cyanobacteriota bacterium]